MRSTQRGDAAIYTLVVLFVIVLAGLSACIPPPMSNEEIIAEIRKCEAAGLEAHRLVGGFDGMQTTRIECRAAVKP